MAQLTETLARRALDRAVGDRHAEFVGEMQRIVEATYGLIERTGQVDPPLRDILREAGLSTQGFYRYFQSKDELLLLLLDDGRRRLLGYLEHRMQQAADPEARLRAWIEGVLAQASRPDAAARTRPFVANQDRLSDAFPEEQQASVDLLIGQVGGVIEQLPSRPKTSRAETRRDALAVYHLVFGALHDHLTRRSQPTAGEIDHLVRFIASATSGRA